MDNLRHRCGAEGVIVMKGLMLKDFFVISKQLKFLLILLPILALLGSPLFSFAIFIGAILPVTAIAYDERSRWNELAVMLPYTRRSLTLNKYLMGYLCVLVASALVVLGQVASDLIAGQEVGVDWQGIFIAVMGAAIFIAINTPLVFKFGSEKSRFVFIIVMILIGVVGGILGDNGYGDITKGIMNGMSGGISTLLIALIVVLFNYLSIELSTKIQALKTA